MEEPKLGLVAHLQAYAADEVLPGDARHLLKGAIETIQRDDAEIERLTAENERLQAIESAALGISFTAYPAHGYGYITMATGSVQTLKDALNA